MTFLIRLLVLAILAFLPAPVAAAMAGPYDFAVIQPGQPGSPEDAQPVMDELAAYLGSRLGVPVAGRYVNDRDQAEEILDADAPAWSIMGLGFFLDHYEALELTPLAATRPGGRDHDAWRVLVMKDGVASLADLSGSVEGSMLYDTAARCLLFGDQAASLAVSGTNRPARALRDMAKGKLAAVVVDETQHSAIGALPMAGDLAVLHTLEGLPASPVVWFGASGPEAERLKDVLLAMGDDPEAQDLLALLQTQGFGPADPGLETLFRQLGEAPCD